MADAQASVDTQVADERYRFSLGLNRRRNKDDTVTLWALLAPGQPTKVLIHTNRDHFYKHYT